MPRMLRNVLAVGLGAVVAIVVVTASDAVVASRWPLPAGADSHDPAQLRAAMAALPVIAFLVMLVGWLLAVSLGAFLATRLSADGSKRHGLIITVLFLLATIVNLVSIPHPVWLAVTAVVLIPLVGWWVSAAASRTGESAPEPNP